MPIKNYGVWVGYPKKYEAERNADDSQSPHISLYYDKSPSSSSGDYRAAINVKSTAAESRLVYWFYRNFDGPILAYLKTLEPGFTPLPSKERNGLDYIRGNILSINAGTLVLHDVAGQDNDIIDYMSPILDQAIAQKAKIYLFGEPFAEGTGIHDIHMNQGNEGKFKKDNGVYQDGGIILSFPDGHFEAVFLAFATQKVHTEDDTGNAIGSTDFVTVLGGAGGGNPPDVPPTGGDGPAQDGIVWIKAALVNPVGPDLTPSGDPETVYLNNRTASAVSVDGWSIINRQGQVQQINGTLKPQGDGTFLVPDCPLSNKGGTISLLNSAGLKVDGVSYSADQAKREGVFLYFH